MAKLKKITYKSENCLIFFIFWVLEDMEGESGAELVGFDARRWGSEVYSNGMSAVCGGVGGGWRTETLTVYSGFFWSSVFKLVPFL